MDITLKGNNGEKVVIPIEDLIFEHRTYLPAVGFCILLSYGIWLFRIWNRNWRSAKLYEL